MDDFSEYIREGEPNKTERALAWQTAIGLQKVDDLEVSKYLIDTARKHIEGDIKLSEVRTLVNSYYEKKGTKKSLSREQEADEVSVRITELLSEKTFTFSPVGLISIHRHLFSGLYEFAGKLRDYNITKKEWVLDNDTVLYASATDLLETLEYDFAKEKKFDYSKCSISEAIENIAKFISDIWQIHPFGEGNTRTTAVFLIKYLRTFGFSVDNNLFKEHSWYFRNALVRANYTNIQKGVSATSRFLLIFFRNLILGENYLLKNREMHISYQKDIPQSAKLKIPKCQIGTLECTLEEIALLNALKTTPQITQMKLSEKLGISVRTLKRMTVLLQEKGRLVREGGRRNGVWKVIE